ncbi:hypothetical protein, partial [Phormidium tenue]|uniref:hypothetical protein n=1 Tax=Phormidium tenue TaxID=126344 RepID=UPI001A7E5654
PDGLCLVRLSLAFGYFDCSLLKIPYFKFNLLNLGFKTITKQRERRCFAPPFSLPNIATQVLLRT